MMEYTLYKLRKQSYLIILVTEASTIVVGEAVVVAVVVVGVVVCNSGSFFCHSLDTRQR